MRAAGPVLKLAGPNGEHLLDVFQLWTAHLNGIPYFATLDTKFIKYMTKTMKNPFSSRPVLPSEVCKENGMVCYPVRPPRITAIFTPTVSNHYSV